MTPIILVSRYRDRDDRCRGLEEALARQASGAGARVWITPHLYHIPEDSGLWPQLAARAEPVVAFLWLRPRAGEWLLRKHGVGRGGLTVHDLSAFEDAGAAWSAVAVVADGAGSVEELAEQTSERWYPVLDRERCIQCRNCLQFCLFGVYGEADGQVTVVTPDACKPGCPACARICPRGAIMFPLYDEDEAIRGAAGQYPCPDAAARRMYYERTGAICPACAARKAAGTPAGGPEVCPECGARLRGASDTLDLAREMDALLDELDARLRRS